MSPRPETADLARRIAAAAIRNGTDPADLPAMYRRAEITRRWLAAHAAMMRAVTSTQILEDALLEFEAIGRAYAAALRELGR